MQTSDTHVLKQLDLVAKPFGNGNGFCRHREIGGSRRNDRDSPLPDLLDGLRAIPE